LDVSEGRDPTGVCAVIYYLEAGLRVKRVDIDDRFKARRQQAADAGRLPALDWINYLGHLRDTVTYWTADGWVTEAQMRESR
jgi:hypothetical protein